MQNNFFEYLCLADMEKVHSQMIAWIFSSDSKAISQSQKIGILQKLGEINLLDQILEVYTEYHNIDVMIVSEQIVFVIENKLKSSQHSNQLHRYRNFITENYPDKKAVFMYLTLIPERPADENWRNISYEQLMQVLEEIDISTNNLDGLLLKEYMKTVSRFVNAANKFNDNHRLYPNVFTDGGAKKETKALRKINDNYDELQNFIAMNRLETIFQKMFWHHVMKEVEKNTMCRGRVGETRGIALMHFTIQKGINIDNNLFEIGLQIQNKTIKLVIQAEQYEKSNKEMIPNKLHNYMKELSLISDFKRVNLPTKHAYISLSKKMDKNLYEYAKEELVHICTEAFYQVKDLTSSLTNKMDL